MSMFEDGEGLGAITLTICIAIGVAVGVTIGGLVLQRVWEAQAVAALKESSEAMKRALAERDRADREAERAAADRKAAVESQQRQQLAQAQRQQAAAATEAAAEAQRRDDAWRKFYRPSPGCGSAATSVDCSNEFIRAKRAFDEKYRRGEL